MSPEQIERILAAADVAVHKTVGEPNLESACEKGHKIFKFFADHLEHMQTRQQIKEGLAKFDEIPLAEEKLLLGIMRYSPQLLRWVFDYIAKKAKEDLPTPPGGRPLALESIDDQRRVCEFVGSLLSHGVELEDAYSRAGQRFGISAKTVFRLWHNRAAIARGERELTYSEVAEEAKKLLTSAD